MTRKIVISKIRQSILLDLFIALSGLIWLSACSSVENLPLDQKMPTLTATITTQNETQDRGYPAPSNEEGYPAPISAMSMGAVGALELFEVEGNLLYQSDETGAYHIYFRENGSAPVNLTSELALAVEGAWSPDGNTIAFATHGLDPTNFVIQLMNKDGSNKRLLLPEQPNLNWRPAWSPDDNQLVFVSNRTGNFEIFKVNLNGTNLENLTNHPANDRDPDWSAVTDNIVFVSDRSNGNGLFLMDPDGKNVVQLLDGTWKTSFPRWSPDGRFIAFTSEKDTTRDIYVMDANGWNIRKVTERPGDNTMPEWVNNDRLLFSGEYGDETWDLFIINVDGTGQKQITGQPPLATYSERYPRWRP